MSNDIAFKLGEYFPNIRNRHPSKESDFDSDYKNAALEDIRFVNGDKDDKIEHRAHNEKHACHKNRSFFMHAKQSNVSNQRVG